MADSLDLPLSWNGPRARVGGNRHRVRLSCDQLESRDATGSIVSGVVAAAFGGPLSDSLSELARLIGDWALLDASLRTSQPASPIGQIADESPRTPARYDTWLEPSLLFAEERPERGVRVTAPAAPADPGRGAFGDLLGGQPHLSGPTNHSPFPSFVGVRVAPVAQASGADDRSNGFGPRAPLLTMTASAVREDSLPGFDSSRVIGAFTLEEEPPNAAPVANNDSATVDEDGSVVIDVRANDSDPDGDGLVIDTWQYDPPYGTVTQEADGQLRYTPFPNFYGIDQFTYKVADGRLTATGTVTVAVISVNDAPVAFNDAMAGNSSALPGWPAPPGTTVIRVEVLGNDIDYDGSGLTVGNLAASGQVAISEDKLAVHWTVPFQFTGETEFEYQTKDAEGALSDWATVKVWSYPRSPGSDDPPPPTVVVNPDEFAVGDDPRVANVRWNDTGGAYAVLTSHPAGTRVSQFEFDGLVKLTPTLARTDAVFEYVLFSANGKEQPATTAKLVDGDLAIYDGQGGTVIRRAEKEKIGAVTVANMNDTDGDSVPDHFDPEVRADPANNAVGVDEVDLMKVVVKQPANMAAGDMVTVQATHAGADRQPLWYSSSTPITGGPNKNLLSTDPNPGLLTLTNADFVNGIKTVWLEAMDKSRQVRDLTVDCTYKGATVTVKATAVWAELTWFHGTGQKAWLPPQNNETWTRRDVQNYREIIRLAFYSNGRNGMLGTDTLSFPYAGGLHHTNGVDVQFTLYPAGVSKDSRVKWDMSRSIEKVSRYWDGAAGKWALIGTDTAWEPYRDKANDDGANPNGSAPSDEINKPIGDNNELYQMDAPGVIGTPAKLILWTDFFQQLNGLEFVRVRFDGKGFSHTWPATPAVQGSRASSLIEWHSWVYFKKTNGVWSRPQDAEGKILAAYNELDRGLKVLNPNPNRP